MAAAPVGPADGGLGAAAGTLVQLTARDFMCFGHRVFDFPAHAAPTFVTGPRGSGKTALVAALNVGLGGCPSRDTPTVWPRELAAVDVVGGVWSGDACRAYDALIRHGATVATTAVVLRNSGGAAAFGALNASGPWRPELYGPLIRVEARIARGAGAPSYTLLNHRLNKVVSTEPRELAALRGALNMPSQSPAGSFSRPGALRFLLTACPAQLFHAAMQDVYGLGSAVAPPAGSSCDVDGIAGMSHALETLQLRRRFQFSALLSQFGMDGELDWRDGDGGAASSQHGRMWLWARNAPGEGEGVLDEGEDDAIRSGLGRTRVCPCVADARLALMRCAVPWRPTNNARQTTPAVERAVLAALLTHQRRVSGPCPPHAPPALPVELWLHICGFLRGRDFVDLAWARAGHGGAQARLGLDPPNFNNYYVTGAAARGVLCPSQEHVVPLCYALVGAEHTSLLFAVDASDTDAELHVDHAPVVAGLLHELGASGTSQFIYTTTRSRQSIEAGIADVCGLDDDDMPRACTVIDLS